MGLIIKAMGTNSIQKYPAGQYVKIYIESDLE